MKLAQYVNFREEKFGAVGFEMRPEKTHALDPSAAVALAPETTSPRWKVAGACSGSA